MSAKAKQTIEVKGQFTEFLTKGEINKSMTSEIAFCIISCLQVVQPLKKIFFIFLTFLGLWLRGTQLEKLLVYKTQIFSGWQKESDVSILSITGFSHLLLNVPFLIPKISVEFPFSLVGCCINQTTCSLQLTKPTIFQYEIKTDIKKLI